MYHSSYDSVSLLIVCSAKILGTMVTTVGSLELNLNIKRQTGKSKITGQILLINYVLVGIIVIYIMKIEAHNSSYSIRNGPGKGRI